MPCVEVMELRLESVTFTTSLAILEPDHKLTIPQGNCGIQKARFNKGANNAAAALLTFPACSKGFKWGNGHPTVWLPRPTPLMSLSHSVWGHRQIVNGDLTVCCVNPTLCALDIHTAPSMRLIRVIQSCPFAPSRSHGSRKA
jgi:hypothetical protein